MMCHKPSRHAAFVISLLCIALMALCAHADDLQEGRAALASKDYARAMGLLKPLAEQGDPKAQFDLGRMSAQGLGVKQDYVEALKWYRKSAEQGHAGSQRGIGALYLGGGGH